MVWEKVKVLSAHFNFGGTTQVNAVDAVDFCVTLQKIIVLYFISSIKANAFNGSWLCCWSLPGWA